MRVIALTTWSPACALRQLGVGRCFINEHQLVGALAKKWRTSMNPEIAGLSDIKPAPFAGRQAFFYD